MTCRRELTDGTRCGRTAPPGSGTLIVVNDRAVRVELCRDCVAELHEMMAPFLSEAQTARRPRTQPLLAPDGSLWAPAEVRLVLKALNLAPPPVGSLGPADRARWLSLYTQDPERVAELRAAAQANPQAAQLILERILADRAK